MNTYSRRDLAALAIAVAVLGAVVLGTIGCGDGEDLFFPGELPATPTDEPTTTPTPDEDDDDL